MAATRRFDPYRILGVSRDATPAQVARAYRAQAKRFHPDLHGPDADRQMRDLNRSWHILSDAARRRAWDAGHPVLTTASHWAGAPRPMSRAAPTTAGSWSPWEAPAPRPADAGRVRVEDTWPRRRMETPATPAGMRDSGWLAAAVAGALLIAVVVLGWVASSNRTFSTPSQALDAAGVGPALRVDLDAAHVVAVFHADGGGLGVATARLGPRGWEGRVLEERAADGDVAVLVAADDSGSSWRTVVYGRVPDERVAQVSLSVASAGGEVVDGLWALGVRAPLRPEQVSWRLVSDNGTVIDSGTGELDTGGE
jgi:hypothetical protein